MFYSDSDSNQQVLILGKKRETTHGTVILCIRRKDEAVPLPYYKLNKGRSIFSGKAKIISNE